MANTQQLKKVNLEITDMTCASCSQSVESALNNTKGVKEAAVNFAAERANIEYNSEQIEANKLVEVIENTGYGVAVDKVTFEIGGMSCASCAQSIEGSLKQAAGVREATVNFAAEKATVEFIPAVIGEVDLEKIIENIVKIFRKRKNEGNSIF